MPPTKISVLPVTAAASDIDQIPIVQAGVTKRVAASGLPVSTAQAAADALLAPKASPTFTGTLTHAGAAVGLNGNTPVAKAAAIATPTSDTVGTKEAIDAIRVALANIGITL